MCETCIYRSECAGTCLGYQTDDSLNDGEMEYDPIMIEIEYESEGEDD